MVFSLFLPVGLAHAELALESGSKEAQEVFLLKELDQLQLGYNISGEKNLKHFHEVAAVQIQKVNGV